ncbi:MAG: hypothetical protein JWP38_732 [Herbaspirillum sp.]|nr:hypothetical protein [Herbaspirillum sp.]
MMKMHIEHIAQRLKWSGYRLLDTIGPIGLGATAVFALMLVAHQGYMMPSYRQQADALTRIASQQKTRAAELARYRNTAQAPAETPVADQQDILDVFHQHGLNASEVKYQQMTAGADGRKQTWITLPVIGRYQNFRSAAEVLTAMPGVRMTSFALSRKTPADQVLAIELKLSLRENAAGKEGK